jgi:hypothetical protein
LVRISARRRTTLTEAFTVFHNPSSKYGISPQISHYHPVPHPSQFIIIVSFEYEEFCLLGYNAVQASQSQPTFRRKMSSSYPRSKNGPGKKPELPPSCWFHAWPFLRLRRWKRHFPSKCRLTQHGPSFRPVSSGGGNQYLILL